MESGRAEAALPHQHVQTSLQRVPEVGCDVFFLNIYSPEFINTIFCLHRGFTYYKIENLDNRISNADQLLTTDIDKFCESVTDVYSNVSKPILDIVLYVYRLTMTLGGKVMELYFGYCRVFLLIRELLLILQTPSILMLYLLVSGVFLTRIRRPTGQLTVQEQKLEGEFRYVNSRLITNSEEV